MKSWLKSTYRREMFSPGWFAIFINPFYFARAGLYRAMTDFAPRLNGRLLDVGCGSKPYRSLFSVGTYVGLDVDNESSRRQGVADHLYDGHTFPFAEGAFDSVLCNQVLEHVFNPDEFLREIARVLTPGGRLLLTVPFVWDEHEQPYDYARYSSFGLRALLEKNGFRLIVHNKLGADVTTLFQLLNVYLFKVIRPMPVALRLLFTVTIMAFVNLFGLLARSLLPSSPDLFLDHVVLAERLQ